MTGLFIVFEGGDGVGKSTQVRFLAEHLTHAGHRLVVTHEPGDTPIGLKIRQVVLDPATGDVDSRAEALLIAADKAQHVFEVIRPALAAGQIVISDRYVDSMVAYQGAGRELGAEEIRGLAEWATGGLVPDLTVILDVDPDRAVNRIREKDRVEGAGDAFHERVRQEFLDLADAAPERYLVLYARDTREANAAAIAARVDALLAERADGSAS